MQSVITRSIQIIFRFCLLLFFSQEIYLLVSRDKGWNPINRVYCHSTGATSGARIAYHSEAPKFIRFFAWFVLLNP